MSNFDGNGLKFYYEAVSGNSSLTQGEWHLNTAKRHAFKIYSDHDADLDGVLTPTQAESKSIVYDTFSNLPVEHNQTKIVDAGPDDENIELELDERILTLLMDQSGSMTWNDNPGMRHDVARRFIERSAATYPGDLNYNLVRFNGLPVNVTLFGVLETNELEANNLTSLSTTFFEDQENNFAGVRVVRNEDRYPQNAVDGEIVQEGFLTQAIDSNLQEGTKYYYTVFTFDKNFKFSNGVRIAATPREQVVPFGLQRVVSNVLIGTGVSRDEHTVALWHFDEEASNIAYDFSNNKNHLTLSNTEVVWLNAEEVPVGISGIRYNGDDLYANTEDSVGSLRLRDQNTFMVWVYPYDTSSKGAILSRQATSSPYDTNYAIYHDGAKLVFTRDGSSTVSTDNDVLSENKWNHVAVTVDDDEIEFYVDGTLVDTKTASGSTTNNEDMKFYVGKYDGISNIDNFFGKITEVSIHKTKRDSSYIEDNSEASQIKDNINQTLTERENNNPDNGDRLVALEYDVPPDFDFSDIRIIRGDLSPPSWEEDGIILDDIDPSVGRFIYTDTDDFVTGTTYYYRVMTKNSIGNFSYTSDSPLLEVNIPEFTKKSELEELSPPLSTPTNVSIVPGNRKNYLSWTNVILDERIARVLVYVSDSGYPVTDDSSSSSGELVFEGKVDDEEFVHRDIENYQGKFYSIVNRDKYGRLSNPVNISAIPKEGLDETKIPLLEVSDVRANIIDNKTISITWESPVDFKSDLTGFLDQRVLIYGSVTDERGVPISEDTEVTMNIRPKIKRADVANNIFENQNLPDPDSVADEDFFRFSVDRAENGIIKGALSMTSDTSLLSLIEKGDFEVEVISTVPDPDKRNKNIFEFRSAPVTVSLEKLISLELENRDGKTVKHECEIDTSELAFASKADETGIKTQEKSFPGSYVRASEPFVVRAKLSYKNDPFPEGSTVRVSVWDAEDNVCSDEFEPKPIEPSTTVLPPATTLEVQQQVREELDESGKPTGEQEIISFVDIPLTVPRFPQGAILYVQAENAGFIITGKQFALMENILNLELSANAPKADGKDVAEQEATIWVRDPDNPEDKTERTTVPDGTRVRWQLIKEDFGKDRPFYSNDTFASQPNGVVSKVEDGKADNVFFGPASGVVWHQKQEGGSIKVIGERYTISASLIWTGLKANEDDLVEIVPLNSDNKLGTRIHMEFDKFKVRPWADGQDYRRLDISRDAANPFSGNRYGSCFKQCINNQNGDLIEMSAGQIVHITTDDRYEIIWGEDISEVIDPYTGDQALSLGTDTNISRGEAFVEMMDAPKTSVYFRINDFIQKNELGECDRPTGSQFGNNLNDCECLNIDKDCPYEDESTVSGSTSLLVDEVPRSLTGGGGMQRGLPPTILAPKEPLDMEVVDIRFDGESSDNIVVDGEAENEIVVEVKFTDDPVPEGTPITVSIASELEGGLSKINLQSNLIRTETYVNEEIDPDNPRSYASVKIDPIEPNEEIFEQIVFETNYDRSGEVERSIIRCAEIEWSPSQKSGDSDDAELAENVFSGKLYAYNISNDEWDESLTPMSHPRGDIILEPHDTYLFAIGGIDTKTISKINERYSLDDDEWEDMEIMPTARFAAQSAKVGNKIYIIGGITGNNEQETLEVSRAVEAYDPDVDDWETLTDMPIIDDGSVDGRFNGIAYGVAQHMIVNGNNRIYILSGITSVDESGQFDRVNDRVLYYDVDNDSWHYTDPFTDFEFEIYKRVAPAAFANGDRIEVFGGAMPKRDLAGNALDFITDSYYYDVNSNNIDQSDGHYRQFPRPRYKASVVSNGTDHYLAGGSNDNSLHLNLFEKIDTSSDPYQMTDLAPVPQPGSAGGLAINTSSSSSYSNVDHVFHAGGFQSGREEGFLQIRSSLGSSRMRLDGKQTVSISFDLVDRNGDPPDKEVTVRAEGSVKFLTEKGEFESSADSEELQESAESQQSSENQKVAVDTEENDLSIYPVLFDTKQVETVNGRSTITLLPRSDDILANVKELLERAGLSKEEAEEQGIDVETAGKREQDKLIIRANRERKPYALLVELSVIDDFYFGKTINNLAELSGTSGSSDNRDGDGSDDQQKSSSGSDAGADICEDRNKSLSTSVAWEPASRGIERKNIDPLADTKLLSEGRGGSLFSFVPPAFGQLDSPVIECFSDIPWIPAIDRLLAESNHDAQEILDRLDQLSNEIPFGASTLLDALVASSNFLSSNNLEGVGKTIYVFTDNESNLSRNTIEETIEAVNNIDGEGETPLIIGNFSVFTPITLSAKANITDTETLNRLVNNTAGQTLTVFSEEFIDQTVNLFTGQAIGSMGYGEATITIDLNQVVIINELSALFKLLENTNGRWSISYSLDGYNYFDMSETYSANDIIDFTNFEARYLRFHVVLVTGFSASNEPEYELIPLPESPALTTLEVIYDDPAINFLYLDKEITAESPQQIVVTVDASSIDPDKIQVGIATSERINWIDYQTPVRPSVSQNGKIFIPIRREDIQEDVPQEPLDKVDTHAFRARNSRWDPESIVEIEDSDGNIIDSSTYKIYPREGLIVFNQRRSGDHKIRILNQDMFRVGVRMISNDSDETLSISGIGYMYNTNIQLAPPVEKLPPEAQNVTAIPQNPGPYTQIQAVYDYIDPNEEPEDVKQRQIRWYINDVHKPFLNDLTSWNNIQDPEDPLYQEALTFTRDGLSANKTVVSEARDRDESLINPDDRVYFTIRVSDGTLFSSKERSNSLIIGEEPPEVQEVSVRGLTDDGRLLERITAGITAVAQFNIQADTQSNQSRITWFVDNSEYKTGIFGEDENIDRIFPGEETDDGIIALQQNNEISVQIQPETEGASGDQITSDPVIVQNARPIASNVEVNPENPASAQNLVVNFDFEDVDIDLVGDSTQENLSRIEWMYKDRSTNNEFVEAENYANQSVLPSDATGSGERWMAVIVPFDGLDFGDRVESNIVKIR